MPRTARIVAPGYYHHIVQRGNNRGDVFFDDHDRKNYLKLLQKFKAECQCPVYAYCLMSNHVHLLVRPAAKLSIAKYMQKVSLCYTQYVNRKYHRTGRLWECRYHSSIVDSENYFWAVCRYIERNPVRAKMVGKPGAYCWSSAAIHCGEGSNTLVDAVWTGEKDKEDYICFIQKDGMPQECKNIKKAVYNGRPLGEERFLRTLKNKFGIVVSNRAKGRPKKGDRE